MNPLVSVIIPTYKRPIELQRALESVLKQTYDNLEIIIVDDNEIASIEYNKTKEMLAEYLCNKNIKYIKNDKKKGGSGSRNKGLEVSNGEYIAFLDDDDEYLEEKIYKQYMYYKEINDEAVGLIYCNGNTVNQRGEKIGEQINEYEGSPLYESMLNCIANTSFWFCTKKALVEIGGFCDTVSKQDNMTIVKLIGAGYKIGCVKEKLVKYYDYSGNKISGTGKKSIEGIINLRSFSRNLYSKLNSEKEAYLVELNFASQLLSLYLINSDKDNAFLELKKALNAKFWSRRNVMNLGKYMFPNQYLKFIKREKKKRFK